MPTITPFLWFDHQAEEAMKFYTAIFKDARIVSTMPGPDGKLMGGTFALNGQEFMVLNGGPMFSFTPAISLFVKCETQAEVDYYWEKLTAGGDRGTLWLAQGSIWPLLADHSQCLGRIDRQPRSGKGGTGASGDVADEEDQHCHLAGGL